MKLRRLSVRLRRADAERAEALLSLARPLALSFDDAADAPLYEPAPGDTPLWPELTVHALFPAEYDTQALGAIVQAAVAGDTRIESQEIAETDWRAALEQNIDVIAVADNLCVVPADFDTPPPGANVVRLNMGLAFGTGRHPTTLLCLQWLAQQPPRRLSVCDFGCGSGVLAIAALRLGAAHAVAIDNDPQAVRAARANAELNGVAGQLGFGTPLTLKTIEVDLVLANILAGTLIASVDTIASALRPGGRIVLSGILEHQAHEVERAFALQFGSFDTTVQDGWARITARLR